MKKIYFALPALLLLLGCSDEAPKNNYSGAKLLEQKCQHCHNLDIPAISFEGEKAPPMMGIVFHLKDFIKVSIPTEKKAKFVDFVTDYVLNPSLEKSFCDEKSLKIYGLMPSQKGMITRDELLAVSSHIYERYDQDTFLKSMAEKARLEKMPLQLRIREAKNCKVCHDIEKDKMGPSFVHIAQRYSPAEKQTLIESMKKGSQGKWEKSRIPMPSFKMLTDEELEAMAVWILSLKKNEATQ